jgi:hypothetical protein
LLSVLDRAISPWYRALCAVALLPLKEPQTLTERHDHVDIYQQRLLQYH